MPRLTGAGRVYQVNLVENSPIRSLDPRAKLWICLCASAAVMTPLDRLVLFAVFYVLFVSWARLLKPMLMQIWRLKWILIFLFIIDWLLVDKELAFIIVIRLSILAGVFSLFFSTTTTAELGLALEKIGIPYRYAYSIKLAFQSLGLLQEEWVAIREAQQSRGVYFKPDGIRDLFRKVGELVALTVPAIVLATRRAWSLTEAAYARGFDSPRRIAYRTIEMKVQDWLFMAAFLIVDILLFVR